MKYLPFLDGKYSVAPGLNAMAKTDVSERMLFQLEPSYTEFIDNKWRCRKENIHKYFVTERLDPATEAVVNRLMVRRLVGEHPQEFGLPGEFGLTNQLTRERLDWAPDWLTVMNDEYISLFDALCSQVPEDVAICQLQGDQDWLAAIHLCAPNHWDPAEKVGRPFSHVHGVVPGMEKLNEGYFRMLITAVEKGPFIRWAWGLSTDTRLNHHPVAPSVVDADEWRGRRIAADAGPVYVRTERQTITGVPECRAFVFTIRTYFYDIDELDVFEKTALMAAVDSMSPASLEYKGLTGAVEVLRQRLIVRK
jgi:hypothetical protein